MAAMGVSGTVPVTVTVVGGGAAGLTAAFFAAREGAKVKIGSRYWYRIPYGCIRVPYTVRVYKGTVYRTGV
jgi:alanine dehydrogenase